MKWFKIKSKEEKQKELQQKLDDILVKYKDEINSYCKIGGFIFILKGFFIQDEKIHVAYKTKESFPGYENYCSLNWWELRYGDADFKKARHRFISFKHDLERVGLKLEII
ncbi:MAG: hypothetical protein [Podoviridae sp. ctrTa16]|nr:MAG: hypothetical protein [Podoviridae sp. ctrTa16]